MTTLVVTFDRIGRHHDVPPLTIDTGDLADVDELDLDAVAEAVYQYARPRLMSSDVDVECGTQRGTIFCGLHTGGTFQLELREQHTETAKPSLLDLADAHGSPRSPEWQRIARALSARATIYREDAVKLAESDDPNLTVWAEAYRLTASALEQLARETEQEAKQR